MIFNNLYHFQQHCIYLLIPIIFILIILLVSSIYDIKFNIIPNYLSKLLIIFSFIYNITLSLVFSNIFFLINSLIFTILIFIFSIILWKIKFWGGGDVKIFSAMAFALSYIQFIIIKESDIFILSIQNLKYPIIFSILLNAILISLPFIIIYLFINFLKENYNNLRNNLIKELKMSNHKKLVKSNIYLSLILIRTFIFNIIPIMRKSSKKSIRIDNLKEGMILDKYYYENYENTDKIPKDNIIFTFNQENINLEFKDKTEDNISYLKSSTGGGLTKEDIILLNLLYDSKLIKNPYFTIKIGIPFLPSLTIGYIIFFLYGDLINILFNFISQII